MSEGNGISNTPGPASSAEPSMEEILASIRRILTEEENERAAQPRDDAEDDVLVLDTPMAAPGNDSGAPILAPLAGTMMEDESSVTHFTSEPTLDSGGIPGQAEEEHYLPAALVEAAPQAYPQVQPLKENNMEDQVQSPEGLVSESAAQEIASKVGSLVRSVSAERAVGIGRPGVTIEDLVREEIKPVLKSWLDSHLPSLVERVVRAEIGRVIDRM